MSAEPQFRTLQTKDGYFEFRGGEWVPYDPKPREQPPQLPRPVLSFIPGELSTQNAGDAVPVGAPIPAFLQMLERGFGKDFRELKISVGALCGLGSLSAQERGAGFVTEESLDRIKHELSETKDKLFEGAVRKGDYPAGIEQALRHQEKTKILEETSTYLTKHGAMIEQNRPRPIPMRLRGPALQREAWKIGYFDGLLATWKALTGQDYQPQNNGHESSYRMKWFMPMSRTLAA